MREQVRSKCGRWIGAIAALGMFADPGLAQQGVLVRDSAGIEIVDNLTPVWKSGKGWSIDPVPAVEIGSEDDPRARFTGINLGMLIGDSTVVVCDFPRTSLTVFGPDGRYRATIGRKGDGPGEFSDDPNTVTRAKDTILVWDGNHRRVSWFSQNGRLERERRFDLSMSGQEVQGLQPDGTLLVTKEIFEKAYPRGRPGVHDRLGTVRLIAATGATAVDFGTHVLIRSVLNLREDGAATSGAIHVIPYLLRKGANPLAIPDSRRWEVKEYGRSGKLRKIIRAPVPRLRTPESFRKVWSGYWPANEIPDTLPAINEVLEDAVGNLWVARPRPRRDGAVFLALPAQYDIIDPKGRWLGTIEIPEQAGKVLDVGDRYLLSVTQNADDVPIVRTYRIRK